jgi:hypothetical protein
MDNAQYVTSKTTWTTDIYYIVLQLRFVLEVFISRQGGYEKCNS